jgi:hypothetical protein
MRISQLAIENFRGVQRGVLENLGGLVVIAGPNGCGKSCIFDAIRLLKSVYGGYQGPNEWHQWYSEYRFDRTDTFSNRPLLRDTSKPAILSLTVELSNEERKYIENNIETLIDELAWQTRFPEYVQKSTRTFVSPTQEAEIHRAVDETKKEFRTHCAAIASGNPLKGTLRLDPDGKKTYETNIPLAMLFSVYRPNDLGVIDYHSANRTTPASRWVESTLT